MNMKNGEVEESEQSEDKTNKKNDNKGKAENKASQRS